MASCDTYPEHRGLFGALFSWLWVWLCHGGEAPPIAYRDEWADRQYRAVWGYPLNRRQRRMRAIYARIPADRKATAFDRAVSRYRTPTQTLERYARIGLQGRVTLFGISRISRCKRRARRAVPPALPPIDSQTGRGLWHVHAVPD